GSQRSEALRGHGRCRARGGSRPHRDNARPAPLVRHPVVSRANSGSPARPGAGGALQRRAPAVRLRRQAGALRRHCRAAGRGRSP
ncbi:MAG: hypothetical protein AVDCRST_MAG88-3742, partial [uncultured Thermomicrobiales bacterium]